MPDNLAILWGASMSVDWFFKRDNTTHGPFTPQQIKKLVVSGEIVDDTPIARVKGGPFNPAHKYKGLLDKPIMANVASVPADDTVETGVDLVDQSLMVVKHRNQIPELNDHPLLALWSLAIASGLLVASLLYAIAWKFAAPVWTYGTALVPVSVTLLIISWYAWRSSQTRFNKVSLVVNICFAALTVVAGLGSIYDMWSFESRMKSGMRQITVPTELKGRP